MYISLTGLEKFILTVILTIMATLIYFVLRKKLIKNKGNIKFKIEEIKLGFYIVASNIFFVFMANFIANYYFI